MTSRNWGQGNDGDKATYTWKNYKLVAVEYTSHDVKWDVRQNDRSIALIERLTEAMDYCEVLDLRLKAS